MSRILIVDDNLSLLEELARTLTSSGHDCITCGSAAEARLAIAAGELDLALLDIHLQDGDGLELLRLAKAKQPAMPVLILTGESYDVLTAVEATKAGAHNFLSKPISAVTLAVSVIRALESSRLVQRNEDLEAFSLQSCGFVGSHPELVRFIRVVLDLDGPIVLIGESGTGKSTLARVIHRLSRRSSAPFYVIDCSAIAPSLIESELFGSVRGAFTGAVDRIGKLEMARGGTLFLDEINTLPPEIQARLLTFLEERSFTPLGGNDPRTVDTRVIAASNRDLRALVDAGSFRADLLARLRYSVNIPPLRERRADIAPLAEELLRAECDRQAKRVAGYTPEALAFLCALPYPRNIRDLQALVELSTALHDDRQLRPISLAELREARGYLDGEIPLQHDEPRLYHELMLAYERDLLVQSLRRHSGRVTQAAASLGLSRDNFGHKLRKHGIESSSFRAGNE
jgi:DNA-binding NtrC family response regulator